MGQAGAGNLLGTLHFGEAAERLLEYRLLEGSCRTEEVVSYLELLAEEAESEGKPVVVVLDNAPFPQGGGGARAAAGVGGEGAEAVLPASVLPAPERHRGGVAEAEGLPDA